MGKRDIAERVKAAGQGALDADLVAPESLMNRSPTQAADSIVFPAAGWVKLYREPAPQLIASWKLLTWRARGLYCQLLTQCNSDGVIPLGKVGLRGIAGLVAGPWLEIEPFVQELVASEWLVWDEPGQLLAVAWFRESQAKQQSAGAKRMSDLRGRQRSQPCRP